ncbi:MAG: RNA polymerase sigma-70 factor [Bacteroidales bacterium]
MNRIIFNNEIFDQLKKGNVKAFASYYDRYYDAAIVFAKRYLKDEFMAEDAVQALFIRLWEQKESIYSPDMVSKFLFTVLKHIVLDMLKHEATVFEKHQQIRSYSTDWIEESITSELESKETSILLQEAILKLSPQKQRICALKIYEGYTNQEIADELNISINTVKVQYTQVLKELRQHLQSHTVMFILVCMIALK